MSAECGTERGYRAHLRHDLVPSCAPCREAHNAYERECYAKRGQVSRELVPCGTPSAWRRHRRRGEEPCPACVLAHRAEVALYARPRRRAA